MTEEQCSSSESWEEAIIKDVVNTLYLELVLTGKMTSEQVAEQVIQTLQERTDLRYEP